MFVGHGLAAFALVAAGARAAGVDAERALQVGLAAALFATLPDVDVLYGLLGPLGAAGLDQATDAFWATGNVVHRGPTHSVLVGVVAAGAFALWHRGRTADRPVAALALAGLVAVALATSGPLDAAVLAAFALVGCLLARASRRLDLSSRALGVAALAGLASHPFGDLLTGQPPALVYPLDVTLVPARLSLAADATVHLLGAFGLELLTVWAALAVAARLTGRTLPRLVDPRAGIGVAYGAAALFITAPTVDVAYRFVFSVLPLGVVGLRPRRRVASIDPWRAVATGLAAVTCAGLAYAAVYLTL